MNRVWMVIVLSLIGANRVGADVHLAPPFGSHMVLQRDVRAKLAGWAEAGEIVTVKLGGRVLGKVVGEGREKP